MYVLIESKNDSKKKASLQITNVSDYMSLENLETLKREEL